LTSGAVPIFAQAAPGSASWAGGPGAAGDNSYVGRIETPRARQSLSGGANLLVSGWAVDTTARGWAGFDSMEVWTGTKDGGSGKKLADGTVGLSRPDIADALGGSYGNSGFNAVVQSSALSGMTGSQTLNVYLHTASKGWWFRSIPVTVTAATAASAVGEPINVFLRPLNESIISQRQKNNRFSLFGYALDQTPITDPGNQTLGPCGCGISSVTIYVDAIQNDAAHNLGTATQSALIGFANATKPTQLATGDFSPVSRTYGRQYDLAGWALGINPTTLTPDRHTFYAVARSSITNRTSVASTTMFIRAGTPNIIAP